MLVGDAVFVGSPNVDGESTNISAEEERLLAGDAEHRIAVDLGGVPARVVDPRSLLSRVVLPLTAGDPTQLVSSVRFESCFDARAWAVVLRQR